MTFFSAFDLQCNRYFDSGKNSKTKLECENEVLQMLVDGCGDEQTVIDFENGNVPNSELLCVFEVRIDEHETKIEEEVIEN